MVDEPRQRDLWVGVGFLTYYETELVMKVMTETVKRKKMMTPVCTCDRCTRQWVGIELGALGM